MLRPVTLMPEVTSFRVVALSNVTENEPVTGSTGAPAPNPLAEKS